MLGSSRSSTLAKSPLLSPRKKSGATDALVGLFTVALAAFVVAALYFGQQLLVPLAVAALLTFMLSPLVAVIERRLGRVSAVFLVTIFICVGLGGLGWSLTRQAIDLASKLPDYRSNIEKKLRAFELSKEGPIKRFSEMVVELEATIPGFGPARPSASAPAAANVNDRRGKAVPVPVPVAIAPVAEVAPNPLDQVRWLFTPFLHLVGGIGVVIVLVIFMLLKREDLRGRVIKMIGQGRISLTSRAMEDAATRVSRYLITQLLVNVAFGAVVAAGLYFIGVPNAFLWGALSAALRFVPYIGAWIAAFFPVVLSLAVSPGWEMVALTFGLYAILELATGNLLEPLLYRSSTGVSSLALIVAAIFWTWLWGPVGLLLATPLTVCLAVMGRHVPRLAFFSVLLGDEEPLTPAEECYHRLLVGGLSEAGEAIDTFLKGKSLTALYDDVLVPTLTLAEMDFYREGLEAVQRERVSQGLRDIVEELSSRPPSPSKIEADKVAAAVPAVFDKLDCRVACVPTRGERDEVASGMLIHVLREQGFEAVSPGFGFSSAKLVAWLEEQRADIVCISLIPPSTVIHARHLCSTLRAHFPKTRIMVGIWGATENLEDAVQALRLSGADEVVVSFAEATVQLVKFASKIIADVAPSPLARDEDARLSALHAIDAYGETSNASFDRMTKKLTQTFDVPIALLTFIDRDRQHFKSQCGLPEELAQVKDLPREESVCAHVVADNTPLVVEDLARDRRFANNPILKKHQLRFYAGVPLHAANGEPIGALCILDTKSRKFSEAELRLLRILGDEISTQLRGGEVAPTALRPLELAN